MSADDDLRLAWHSHRDGRLGRRDALLTLAVADADPASEWLQSARNYLVTAHPGHLYSGTPDLDEALADRRVMAGLAKLRHSFPPQRVRSLLFRSEVSRGPYRPHPIPIPRVLDDLLAPSRAQPRGPLKLGTAAPAPASERDASPARERGDDAFLAFYLNVLLGVAMLCALVQADSRDGKAAA